MVALHDLNLAANYCQRLILLKAGRIAATGAPAEVLTPENIEQTWCVKANVYRADAGMTIGLQHGRHGGGVEPKQKPCDIAIAGFSNLAEA